MKAAVEKNKTGDTEASTTWWPLVTTDVLTLTAGKACAVTLKVAVNQPHPQVSTHSAGGP